MTVHYEADRPVVVITIDRPEVCNAIDRPTAKALADAMRRFDEDPDLSVAVLTGAGGKFCAGADLKAMNEPGGERVSRVEVDGDGPDRGKVASCHPNSGYPDEPQPPAAAGGRCSGACRNRHLRGAVNAGPVAVGESDVPFELGPGHGVAVLRGLPGRLELHVGRSGAAGSPGEQRSTGPPGRPGSPFDLRTCRMPEHESA